MQTPVEKDLPVKDSDFEPSPPHMPNFSKKSAGSNKKKIGLFIGIAVAVLLLGGGAAWWFLLRDKPQAKPATTLAPTQQQAPTMSEAEASTPQTFKSTKLNIEFIHRTDWTVTESPDKSEVIITSPKTSYEAADGKSVEDVFTLKMRNGAIPEAIQTNVIKAVAVRDSVTIAYDHPTDQQRQYTNIADAGKDASTFNFMVVSGSTAYKSGQPLGYGVNLTGNAYMFAGGFGEDKDDALVFNDAAKSVLDSSIYTQALSIIKSLKIY